jgi:osmoprotectant transport system permease protein
VKKVFQAVVLVLSCVWLACCGISRQITIGSKEFTESVILGDLATALAKNADPHVTHLKGLGGTRILWDSLINGEIDLYPEYTGTLVNEVFAGKGIRSQTELSDALAALRIRMSHPLGFDDSYALGMKRPAAGRLKITRISDLKKHPELRLGFSNEFMSRRDGWPGLRRHYGLPQQNVEGLEHQLAYRALDEGAIAVTDVYSTDADIVYYDLTVLQDDLHFFPDYSAVFVYREELASRSPAALRSILRLEGIISQSEMIRMNAEAMIQKIDSDRVAAEFLERRFSIQPEVESTSLVRRVALRTRQHLFLVFVSLFAAVVAAIPLGILAYWNRHIGRVVLSIVGLIQTIPSLALVVFMIPLLGIGDLPAIVALFLYSLLPIVRNLHSGLQDIPSPLRESAEALGLPRGARLRLIELPLAARSLLSGIKTSAVINVGTATLGALIGAGGYGQPILTGIRLNNVGLILEGAIPAAGLALLVQGLFDLLEQHLLPKGLRI